MSKSVEIVVDTQDLQILLHALATLTIQVEQAAAILKKKNETDPEVIALSRKCHELGLYLAAKSIEATI